MARAPVIRVYDGKEPRMYFVFMCPKCDNWSVEFFAEKLHRRNSDYGFHALRVHVANCEGQK